MADQPKMPTLYRNMMSLIGLIIAVVALANIIFFAAIEMRGEPTHPYAGILAFMILPAFLILGLVLVFAGAILERRRRHRAAPDEIPRMPILNLNDRRHRMYVFAFVVGGAVFAMVSTVGAYEAYHYSDSVKFCGTTCHDLMIPEYTAYLNSPHARVPCVDCHVGPGATWFVRYKFDGMYQVYATLFKKYPKPIPTPVSNLRPAQDTCEQCHWPAKFWGSQLKTFHHFMYDEQNTPRETQMLLKVGGGQAGGEGIHWHMNIANEITYVAADRQRQVIPWVRMRNRTTGEVTEYTLADTEMTPQQIAAA
ncbi:MAG TPA: NapC/NirT family cytochrome c, partial [Thermoanaerobaculia bacterium]